ncbi:unnamed protein product, partial [marine sediment metagenome]
LQQAITAQQELKTPPATPAARPTVKPPAEEEEPSPGEETVPSQADLFKAEGQRIGFGTRKGDIKLEAVVTYVERIADLDDLTSVWNALTEMGVATDVKKRWIKLYAQNLPGKEIPAELKAKLETGIETEKVAVAGEVAAKPKRFSVVNGQIIGDPEGDYNFKEALQLVSGASPAQAAEMATILAKTNTDTLNLLIPILTKESGEDTLTKLLLTQISDLQKEMREGQKSSPEIQALTQQLDQLRETLHNEQLARIQEQNQAQAKEMIGNMGRLEQQIRAIAEGKQVESRIGLLSKGVDKISEGFDGLRQDVKPLIQALADRGAAPGTKTQAEKKKFGVGLEKGIERAKEATQLEDDLFFGKES